MMLQPGSQIAQFKIIQKLGQGGMGAVYLAEDQKLHRQVALKTLSQEMFDNPEHKERFVREARTAAQVSHGNVMAIYDIDSATDAATGKSIQYIVMEYIKGQSLTEYLRTSKVDMAGVVRLAEKIGAGLAAAHKLRIVHRDIKSDNIILDEQHEPKILDFGLAKPIDPVQMEGGDATNTVSQELTRAGKILGTVSYMSPEQIKGEQVDTRSDIFSFGILLYRMATGESPFEGGTQVSTLAKILESAPEPPQMRNVNVPAELERIIDKCLQKDPNDRYQDTRDLVVDLRNLRKSYDSGSTDTVTVVREAAAKKAKVKTGGFSLSWKGMTVALFGMLLLFVVIMELIEGKGPRRSTGGLHAGETGIAILGFDNQTKDTSLNWLSTGLPEILMTDLAENQSLRVVSRQRLIDAAQSTGKESTDEELRDAAEELGASNLLSGTYFKLGDQVRIDARLEEISTGKIILAEKVVGADPFKLVDSLSAKVRLAMNVAPSGADATTSVAKVTSASPEAYKLYLSGMKRFGENEYESAIADFEKALSIDSTLALAYMRIGMALTFTGKQTKGLPYFAKARALQDHLPVRERSLVDVYANIWLDHQLGEASTKLKQMVTNYPEDKEVRAVYGIFLGQLNKDTTGAFAQFDSALSLDPTYHFVIGLYAQLHGQYQNWPKAEEWERRLVEISPRAENHRQLAVYLSRQAKFQEAAAEIEKAISIEPENLDNYSTLISLYLRTGELAKAEALLPKEKSAAKDDPYKLIDYFDDESNIYAWHGQFRKALASGLQKLTYAHKTKDSTLIFEAYSSQGSRFSRLEMTDSSTHYFAQADKYANVFQRLTYPMTLIGQDPKNEKKARPLLAERLTKFKERLPAAMWPMADALQHIFDAACANDSSALIAGYKEIIAAQNLPQSSNNMELGIILVERGLYADGEAELLPIATGPLRSTSGMNYPRVAYYLGRAEEGLGNKQKAGEWYKEMLKCWGSAEIETKDIKDAKLRLSKLTG